ncbi:cytochrome C biogenesis protein [Achromatium sp. WMS2]|nr:cytochrome C biogenesis protein [Achromatium sp. WMS2]
MIKDLLTTIVGLLYLGSAGLILARLLVNKSPKIPRYLGLICGSSGVVIHIILLYQVMVTPTGMNFGFFNVLSLDAWLVLVILMVSSITKPVENLGIIAFPVATIVMGLERVFPTAHFMSQTATLGLKIHILVSLLAYSLLTLASIQALLLAIQDHQLHAHHPGGFIRALPSLQTMESLMFEMIGAGFILLTISLASGLLFLENMFAQHLAHKTILSILGWFLFGTLLVGRLRAGWRGKTAVILTLSGFMVLMIAYFGSKAVLELILRRH